jgi:hypothetical protein
LRAAGQRYFSRYPKEKSVDCQANGLENCRIAAAFPSRLSWPTASSIFPRIGPAYFPRSLLRMQRGTKARAWSHVMGELQLHALANAFIG